MLNAKANLQTLPPQEIELNSSQIYPFPKRDRGHVVRSCKAVKILTSIKLLSLAKSVEDTLGLLCPRTLRLSCLIFKHSVLIIKLPTDLSLYTPS